jgi:hypothetical protein
MLACVIDKLQVLVLVNMGRLKDGVCVCVCVWSYYLPLDLLVNTNDYLWLEQRLIFNSLLQMGFGCLGGHIKFGFLNGHQIAVIVQSTVMPLCLLFTTVSP